MIAVHRCPAAVLLVGLTLSSGLSSPLFSQAQGRTQAQSVPLTPPAPLPGGSIHTADDPDLTREAQLGVREQDYVGLVWWIPFEFWQVSGAKRGIPAETTAKNMKALKDYTIVAVFLAKVSGLGSFDFIPVDEIRKNIVLRDDAGNDYRPIPEPSQDAKNVASMLKPILAAAMGKAGENFDMFFFPARSKTGDFIADATRKGQFSIVLKNNIVGVTESVYQWHTPLTSIVPARYCPAGKERVHADWDYCPRHGVALNQPPPQ